MVSFNSCESVNVIHIWTAALVIISTFWFSNFVLSQCPRGTRSAANLPCVNGGCAGTEVCNNATGRCCVSCAQMHQLRRIQLRRAMNRGNLNSPILSRGANFRRWGRGWRNTLNANNPSLARQLLEQQKAAAQRRLDAINAVLGDKQ